MKFEGKVVEGFAVGNKFGIATANIEVEKKPKLKEGVYFVEVLVGGENHKALMHFGHRRTFGGEFAIEVHLLDFDQNIYSKEVIIKTLGYVRPTETFRNSDQLYSQIEKDIVMARKYFVRQDVWDHWKHVGEAQKKTWEAQAIHHILEDQDFLTAEIVLAYAPHRQNEIYFMPRLMEVSPHKAYYFPKVHGDSLYFYQAKDYHHLKRGFRGILEPRESHILEREALQTKSVIMFVPAVAIDHDHIRLGQGGGYYDRYLAELKEKKIKVKTVGVLPLFAYKEKLPSQAWDERVEKLILV